MKKILIITDTVFSQINGVTTSLENTANILRQKGHKITIIHHELFRHFSLAPWFPEVHFSFFLGKKIRKALIKDNPDHVHILTEGSLGLYARMLCVGGKIKFTTAYHTNYGLYAKERVGNFISSIIESYLRWFHKGASLTMVGTESLKEYLEKKGYKNIAICPPGVDVNLFKKPDERISPYPKPIFTYLGRLAKEKNVVEYLGCDLPGTKLVIGDGPQKKQLERAYRTGAIFLGTKTGQELVNLLAQSDVLVFPSKTDTFGLVIVEALACGVPVAAHNVMGPKDIITHNVDGFLDENLELAARECLKLDRSACRKKALMFSWENSAEIFLDNLK
jgi:glycosyltransferase involved in cell wall biosynthesis